MLDVILVGGGLANSLIAWRLRDLRPELTILVVEQAATLGGNHTWSFYHHDVTDAQRQWLAPFIVVRWPGYKVRFPDYERRIDTPYYTVSSDRLHHLMIEKMADDIRLNCRVDEVGAGHIVIDGQKTFAAVVIDGRGQSPSDTMRYAWQKFVGLEVCLTRPHGQELPVIMDATVPQTDGYRFVYTLPFTADTMLVEDTYYSDTPEIDAEQIQAEIMNYIRQSGWEVAEVIRREAGVLPITLSGDIDRFWAEKKLANVPCAGLRAALFHPTTGYSLLYAVALADGLCALETLDTARVLALTQRMSKDKWRRDGFFRLLNRMLFYAAQPALRYKILQRFYRLSTPLINRFYAGHLDFFDKLRILAGKPPVPIFAALRAILNGHKT